MSSNKSPALNGITHRLVKLSITVIAPVLATSLISPQVVLPSTWNCNYRPIALTSIFLKIMESVVSFQSLLSSSTLECEHKISFVHVYIFPRYQDELPESLRYEVITMPLHCWFRSLRLQLFEIDVALVFLTTAIVLLVLKFLFCSYFVKVQFLLF